MVLMRRSLAAIRCWDRARAVRACCTLEALRSGLRTRCSIRRLCDALLVHALCAPVAKDECASNESAVTARRGYRDEVARSVCAAQRLCRVAWIFVVRAVGSAWRADLERRGAFRADAFVRDSAFARTARSVLCELRFADLLEAEKTRNAVERFARSVLRDRGIASPARKRAFAVARLALPLVFAHETDRELPLHVAFRWKRRGRARERSCGCVRRA
jgi:hypothetical protein